MKIGRIYIGIFLLIISLSITGCIPIGCSGTFTDTHNYFLTDAMQVVNTAKGEELKSISFYARADTAKSRWVQILDTTFKVPVDQFEIPFERDPFIQQHLSIHISMDLTYGPSLYLTATSEELMQKSKIFFQGEIK